MNARRSNQRRWRSTAVLIVLLQCLRSASHLFWHRHSPVTAGDICVNEIGWWRNNSTFNANTTTPIQASVDNATAGETICVAAGDYSENVDVNKQVTLAGGGAGVVTVTAVNPADHVFDVTADYVNLSGFTATGAMGYPFARIHLTSADCNISTNVADSNYFGIYLHSSGSNTLTNNTADLNNQGIFLLSSSNNALTNNTASDNSNWDIYIENSPSTFTDNTLNGTTVSFTYSGDVSLKGVGSPAADLSGRRNIGKFINATNQSAGAWLYLNFSYSSADVRGPAKSSLTVWKYNGTTWLEDGWNGTRYLNLSITNKVVGVNITSFSVFAPMAVAAGKSSTRGSRKGTYPPVLSKTPVPDVTAKKAPTVSATGTATESPPGKRVTQAEKKKKPAAARAPASAAEGTTAGTKGAPGFTAVSAIAGMLAVAYAMLRRRG